MQNKKCTWVLSILMPLSLLSGCSVFHTTSSEKDTPPYVNKEAYNWQAGGCYMESKSADITLATDGHLSGGKLRFTIKSDVPLSHIPQLLLTHNPNFYPQMEGDNTFYAFEMPYKTPYEKSHLLKPESYLIINYMPIGAEYELRAAFETNILAEHLAQIEELCYDHSS